MGGGGDIPLLDCPAIVFFAQIKCIGVDVLKIDLGPARNSDEFIEKCLRERKEEIYLSSTKSDGPGLVLDT